MSAAGLSALLRSSNTVFLGEAGCGKSELAVHLALELAEQGKAVHFFDLDQTKPLMRSRDAETLLADAGAAVHFEQQHADAPTQVGGLVPLLLDESKNVILDVGGNDTGAKLIGGCARDGGCQQPRRQRRQEHQHQNQQRYADGCHKKSLLHFFTPPNRRSRF